MPWKGTGMSQDESKEFERLWPLFHTELGHRGRREFTVDDFMKWVQSHPEYGVWTIKSNQRKMDVRPQYPDCVILDAQNALYHLSANSPHYVIHDQSTGHQITVLNHVSDLTYRVL